MCLMGVPVKRLWEPIQHLIMQVPSCCSHACPFINPHTLASTLWPQIGNTFSDLHNACMLICLLILQSDNCDDTNRFCPSRPTRRRWREHPSRAGCPSWWGRPWRGLQPPPAGPCCSCPRCSTPHRLPPPHCASPLCSGPPTASPPASDASWLRHIRFR